MNANLSDDTLQQLILCSEETSVGRPWWTRVHKRPEIRPKFFSIFSSWNICIPLHAPDSWTLGLVPGLGYAYSGEWGNMVRSMVLNGLFGWAMYECADRDEWGLFAVATFFELTWYTGSVYGGVDAAHRYNRERLEDAAAALRGTREPAVRRGGGLPILGVSLSF